VRCMNRPFARSLYDNRALWSQRLCDNSTGVADTPAATVSLVMASLGRPLYFCPVISSFFLSSIFFPRVFSAIADGCLPYFHTWCGLSANLRCRSETCCARLAENTGRKNSPKIVIWAPSHNFVGLYIFATGGGHVSTIGKKNY